MFGEACRQTLLFALSLALVQPERPEHNEQRTDGCDDDEADGPIPPSGPQSALMPASRTTFAYLVASDCRKAANCSGVPGAGVIP
jgi:hypothetical protein